MDLNDLLSEKEQDLLNYAIQNNLEDVKEFLYKYEESNDIDKFNEEKYKCVNFRLCANQLNKKIGARYLYVASSYSADVIGEEEVEKEKQFLELSGNLLDEEAIDGINIKLISEAFLLDDIGNKYYYPPSNSDIRIIKIVSDRGSHCFSNVNSKDYVDINGKSLKNAFKELKCEYVDINIGKNVTVDRVNTGHITSNNNLRTSTNYLLAIAGEYVCNKKLEWANRLSNEQIKILLDEYGLYENSKLLIPGGLSLDKFNFNDIMDMAIKVSSNTKLNKKLSMQISLCLLSTKEVLRRNGDITVPKDIEPEIQSRMDRLSAMYIDLLDYKELFKIAQCWHSLSWYDLASFTKLSPIVLLPFIIEDIKILENNDIRVGYLKEKYSWSHVDLKYEEVLAGYKYTGSIDFTIYSEFIEDKLKLENVSTREFSRTSDCSGGSSKQITFPNIELIDSFGYELKGLGNMFVAKKEEFNETDTFHAVFNIISRFEGFGKDVSINNIKDLEKALGLKELGILDVNNIELISKLFNYVPKSLYAGKMPTDSESLIEYVKEFK